MLRQTALLIGLVAMVGVATARYGRYSRRRVSYGGSDGVVCPNRKRQCHPDAVCVSEAGRDNYKTQYRCQCKHGYSGDGYSCTDIDECVENTHNCDDNANCTNTAGGYTCACREGFTTCGACCEAPPPTPILSSCKAILENDPTSQNGSYTVRLENATSDIQVYCDMTTEGGGWTLVYSYTFTDYANFQSSENDVTPRPNWPDVMGADDVSTTTPTALWDTQTGAMDTTDWAKIGSEFLAISNINNWYKCSPNTSAEATNIGSLVTFKPGLIVCVLAKMVSTDPQCNSVPTTFSKRDVYGYALNTDNFPSYLWENTMSARPNHFACANDINSYEKNVMNPGGAILLR